MEIRSLRYFVEVVRQRGFTRAAETLHVTQPAISKMVRALETELGQILLIRTGRTIALTDAGRVVFEHGQRLLAGVGLMYDELDALGALEHGELRLGFPPMVGVAFLAPLVQEFRARYPGISLAVSEDGALSLEDGVLSGAIELAVTVLPTSHSELAAQEFANADLCLLAPVGTRWLEKSQVSMDELDGEPLVLYTGGFALADRILSACREAGFEAKIAARSGQWDFMAELVAARVGLAFLPRPLCERLSRERFGWIPLVEPRIMWRLAFVWLRDGYLSHAARAFLDMLKTNYPPSPTGKAPR